MRIFTLNIIPGSRRRIKSRKEILSVMDAHEGSLTTEKPASIRLKESFGNPYIGSWRF